MCIPFPFRGECRRDRSYTRARGWEAGLLAFTASRLEQTLAPAPDWDVAARLVAALEAPDVPLDRVLVIHGAEDPIVPVANSRRLAGHLGARLVEVPGAGHCPHEEVPGEVEAAVSAFLDEW